MYLNPEFFLNLKKKGDSDGSHEKLEIGEPLLILGVEEARFDELQLKFNEDVENNVEVSSNCDDVLLWMKYKL